MTARSKISDPPDTTDHPRLPGKFEAGHASATQPQAVPLNNAELVQLQSRVIALENLVVALLAQGTVQQLDLARTMARYISPRPGFTLHPLTVHAAARMVHFVERADHFRGMPS